MPSASLVLVRTSAAATGSLEVRWTGPNGPDDYIVFARPSARSETRQYSYTRKGNPLPVRVPGEPGEYELRYVRGSDGTVLARQAVTVTPVTATISAPDAGTAGAELPVTFAGPKAKEDWIGVAKPGAPPFAYERGAWVYADHGSPARLQFPVEPGAYEVRYVSGLNPRVLAARTIQVAPATATLAAPPRGMAGSSIAVDFRGETAGDSFIGVVPAGSRSDESIAGAYARPRGSQVSLRLPGTPGAYEVRFVLEANGIYKVLASSPITIEPAIASVTAPARVARASRVSVAFSGPKGAGDTVAIAPINAEPKAFLDFQDAAPDRASVTLTAPRERGTYEIRYIMRAPDLINPVILARQSIATE